MRSLLRHLQFRPHGDRLLTSSAAFWLFSARVLILAMAGSEMIAWGYLGYLFGDGWASWAGAIFTGFVIFAVVWMIDVSLITLDRAWAEHAKVILGQDSSSSGRRMRELFTFGLRIGLLLGSLSITSPYLAQVVFYKDIQQFTAAEAASALDSSRKAIAEKYSAAIAMKEAEATTKQAEYEREVAGKGPSGRYGSGPAALAMLSSATRLAGERDSLLREREISLSKFDELSRDWQKNREQLATKYNTVLPKESVLQNRKALETLRERPENRSTEWAIKAFLIFIFSGLLLLKLFEPSSVRLYLSEVLQQEYDRYLAGTFDALLPPTERSTAKSATLSPQRLYDFLARVWAPAKELERTQADGAARTAAASQSMDVLEIIHNKVAAEWSQTKNDVVRLRTLTDQATHSLTELNSAIAGVTADIQVFQAKLGEVDRKKLDEEGRIQIRSFYNTKLKEADRALGELRDALPTEERKLQRAEQELAEEEKRLRDREEEVSETAKRIRELRQRLSDSATARAASILVAVK